MLEGIGCSITTMAAMSKAGMLHVMGDDSASVSPCSERPIDSGRASPQPWASAEEVTRQNQTGPRVF